MPARPPAQQRPATPTRPTTPQRPPAQSRPDAKGRPNSSEQKTEVFRAARTDAPTEAFRPAASSTPAAPTEAMPRIGSKRSGDPREVDQQRLAEPGGPSTPTPSPSGAGGTAPKAPRRRRTGLIIALVVVLVFLVIGDRLAARIAAGEVVKKIQASEQLPKKPKATFGGIPFLTQPIFGKYTDLGITINRIKTPGPCIDEMNAHLKGMHVSLASGISGKVGSVPVDHVSGSVRVTFADLNAYLTGHPVSLGPLGSLTLHAAPAENGVVTWSATGGVNTSTGRQQVDEGSMKVKLGVSGQNLTVAVTGFTVNQVPGLGSLGSGLLNQLGASLGNFGGVPALPLPIPLSKLPFNPRLTKVDTGAAGLEIGIAADHIKLPAPSSSSQSQPVQGC